MSAGSGVPEEVEVVVLEGDGIGPEIMPVALRVLEAAVRGAYGAQRKIRWAQALAGKAAFEKRGSHLPAETLNAVRAAGLALKGPIETPIGRGIRSVNVALRQTLDLYACIRPVRHFPGVPTPICRPETLDVVIFRENTEDVYAGIEWQEGSPEALRVIHFLRDTMGASIPEDSGIGIKPMSVHGSKRLVRKAIQYALDHGRRSVTLVHKGNIMKFTEGAFRQWGYEVATREFADRTVLESETRGRPVPAGALLIKDRIADAMFQEILLRPAEYDVLALSNLNGDYISDAAAAQVGGLGLAPGANVGDSCAVFEATHGTAPDIAGKGIANPGSLVLSGAMLLSHVGWPEASIRVEQAIAAVLASGRVTRDLEPGGALCALSTQDFGQALVEELR